jgi:iron complex outermembrane receptor protein
MTPARTPIAKIIALSLALTPLLQAQTTAPSTPASGKSPDDTVKLSEFTVSADSEQGYIASESVTGTRVATKIKDLPFSVSVITKEFMRDFDFFDIAKDMVYTASLNNVDSQGNSSLRGYGATFTLRNGFYRLGLNSRVNTDRIEVIKGPNAAIYGSTSPAGLINYVSTVPKFTPSQEVSFTVGGNEFNRGEISVNTPLGSLFGARFAQLVNVEASNLSSETTYGRTRNRLISYSLLSKFLDGSTLNFELEWSKKNEVTSTSQIPFEYNIAKKTYSMIQRKDLAHFSQGGPDSTQNRELTSLYLTYDKRYNAVFSTHAGGYVYARHAFNFNNSSTDQFDPSTGKFNRSTNVITDPLNEDGGGVQVDTLADYKLLDGKIRNKTLFTVDVSQNWRYREQHGINTKLWSIGTPSLINPDYTLPPRYAFNVITRRDKVRFDVHGFLIRQQVTLLDEKLILFGSLRRDEVTYNFNFGNQYSRNGGALATPGAVAHYTDRAWSPNFGANYKLTPNISLYSSHSQSFSPQGQVAKLGDPHLENETSVGWDYGIKASYLNDTLIFTLGGFYIDRYGVKTTQLNLSTGLNESVSAGTQLAKGVEFEGSWRVNSNLMIQASYSYVNARVVYNGNSVTDVGQMPAGLPIDQASFLFKYSFNGFLKGLAWNAAAVYSGVSYPNSTAALNDVRRYINAPSYAIVNTGLTYTWNQGSSKLKQSVRLSAKNLFNRDYETSRGNLGDPRGLFFTYTIKH